MLEGLAMASAHGGIAPVWCTCPKTVGKSEGTGGPRTQRLAAG
jgi:hypothetical protein